MSRRSVRLERAVGAILGDRRPRGFDADRDEAAQLRAAAALRGGHPGSDMPRPEFVDQLAERMRAEAASSASGATGAARPLTGRRGFLRGAGIAAAAIAAGIGVDRGVVALDHGDTSPGAAAAAELVPDAGAWRAVATLDAVRAAPATRFRSGSVEGVLVPSADGGVKALSAVCTHLGCLLTVDAPAQRLACPCHRATFGFDGVPGNPEYLKPLPRLQSRVRNGQVEVFTA